MSDIFVSYKREDGGRARALVAVLRDAGFATFWDQDISPGANWQFALEAALDDARLCIVLWSRHSVGPEGHFVREEARRAAQRGAYLGVLVDTVLPPLGFGEWQAFDATDWTGDAGDPALAELIAHVGKRLDAAGPPPEPCARPAGKKPRPDARPKPSARRSGALLRRGLVAGLAVAVVAVGLVSYGEAQESRCQLRQNDAVARLRSAANQLQHRNETLVGAPGQVEPPIDDAALRLWWTGLGDRGATAGRHVRSLVDNVFSPAHGLEIADEDGRYLALPPIDEIIDREGGDLRGVLLPLFTGPAEGAAAAATPDAPADDLRAAARWLDDRVNAYADPAALRIAGGCGLVASLGQ
ncbi:toll/interleukin-1 receptor domain-containing protein [Sphingosinicella sp. YJ22]|uniref:toll/interleukin-1 receptor domain-containing protein n=1 Tax=Sphingosinicella sp. YJ22 TaxID=1104780 RepID=UPI00140A4E8A|nr:toll/interleukin-1 receptor domain-containing protein [Sphingosinicella sp. YJ22]